MRKLILATVSAIALGIAGAGPLYAADNNATANPPLAAPTATQTPATGTMQPATPQAGASMQQASPSMNGNDQMSGNNQYNNDQASASQASGNWGRVSRSDVQQTQQKLQQDGLYRGKIDGLEGPETQQALRTYQRKNGLPVTGTVDQQTLANLNGNGTGMGSSTPPNASNGINAAPSSNAGANGGNGADNQSMPNNHHP
jgi:peptidoglycan hydrolase-like protein with peptidoglycan-binding domain